MIKKEKIKGIDINITKPIGAGAWLVWMGFCFGWGIVLTSIIFNFIKN